MGAFFIFLATVLVGARKYNLMCERRHLLENIRSSLRYLEGTLRITGAPLEECFFKSGSIFRDASLLIKKGTSPRDAIRKTALSNSYLEKGDKEALFLFAEGLFAEDCEGQIKNVQALSEKINSFCAEASESIKTKGKLFLRGGVLCGAALFILVI